MYEPLKERMNNGAKAQQPPKQLDGVALLATDTQHAPRMPPSSKVVLSKKLSAVALFAFPSPTFSAHRRRLSTKHAAAAIKVD